MSLGVPEKTIGVWVNRNNIVQEVAAPLENTFWSHMKRIAVARLMPESPAASLLQGDPPDKISNGCPCATVNVVLTWLNKYCKVRPKGPHTNSRVCYLPNRQIRMRSTEKPTNMRRVLQFPCLRRHTPTYIEGDISHADLRGHFIVSPTSS